MAWNEWGRAIDVDGKIAMSAFVDMSTALGAPEPGKRSDIAFVDGGRSTSGVGDECLTASHDSRRD